MPAEADNGTSALGDLRSEIDPCELITYAGTPHACILKYASSPVQFILTKWLISTRTTPATSSPPAPVQTTTTISSTRVQMFTSTSQRQSPRLLFSLNYTRELPISSITPHSLPHSLLERPDNHHMIRWDPAGEHIIVERPEQLALHVLPSIYRQSRFASFSRQLNVCICPLLLSSLNSPPS